MNQVQAGVNQMQAGCKQGANGLQAECKSRVLMVYRQGASEPQA